MKNLSVAKTKSEVQNSTTSNEIDFSGIAVDFVSKNLEEGYIGYLITLNIKKNNYVKKAKVNYSFCDVSWMNWPELVIIQNNDAFTYFGFDFFGASRWWTGYSYRFSDNVPPLMIGYFEYDGPWRSKICTGGSNTNVDVSWVSYD